MLKLDDEYFITADQTNFVLTRKYKPTKDPIRGKARDVTETVLGYYGSVKNALMRYRQERIRDWVAHDRMDLAELVDRIVSMDDVLKNKLKRLEEPPQKETKKK